MSARQPDPPVRPAEDIDEADPFAARERTELAWTRTAIAFAAMGAALLKIRPWTGVPIIGFSAIVWLLGQVRRTRAPERVVTRRVRVVAVAIVALAITAAILVLVERQSAGLRILSRPARRRRRQGRMGSSGRAPELRGQPFRSDRATGSQSASPARRSAWAIAPSARDSPAQRSGCRLPSSRG